MSSAGAEDRPSGGGQALAVGALISAFVFAPLGVVLGLVARARIRRTGESGDGLATAAVIIGLVVTAGLVFFAL